MAGGAVLTLGRGDEEADVYDIENRLVSVTGAHNATLAYDPLGRLSQLGSNGVTTTFLYDGDALVAEYEGATLRHRYAHWTGSDVPLLSFTDSDFNSPNYLHADQQGSIMMLSGAGTPTINRYDEYGIPQSTNAGRFQYTGQAYLAELGLYYYKARMYSPTLGRFLQTDPVGYQGGINLYAYVGNNPGNLTDPTGRDIALRGSQDDRKRFIRLAEKATGLRLSQRNGLIHVDHQPRNLTTAARTFVTAANAPDTNRIVLDVVHDIPVLGDSYASNLVDVADLESFQTRDQTLGSALLTHIVAERYDRALMGENFFLNHRWGLEVESSIMGAYNRQESCSCGNMQFLAPGDTINFQYRSVSGNVVSSYTFVADSNLTPR